MKIIIAIVLSGVMAHACIFGCTTEEKKKDERESMCRQARVTLVWDSTLGKRKNKARMDSVLTHDQHMVDSLCTGNKE